jgi:holliday junction DNA helicase RuvB
MEYEPKSLDDFIGQNSIKRELGAMLVAKDNSNVLLRGNYGGGKTTLANIYGIHRGPYNYNDTPGGFKFDPYFLQEKNIKTIIIDEIHLAKEFEQFYDLMGKYTFVFCTTERDALPAPFVSRCVELALSEYSDLQMYEILKHKAREDRLTIPAQTLITIAGRSRGTPRTAIQLMKRVINLSKLDGKNPTPDYVETLLNELKVYGNGLIEDDVFYLNTLDLSDRPISLNSLSAAINRPKNYVETNLEPFLLNRGFVSVTARGRIITSQGRKAVSEIYELEQFKEAI